MFRYTCYGPGCAQEKECPHCGQDYEECGKEYDGMDFSLELQERLIFHGQCCVCGSFQVEM